MRQWILIAAISTVCVASPCFAVRQTQPAAAEAAEATTKGFKIPDGPLTITITAAQGFVQTRENADAKWVKVAAGDVLKEGAELRTGPKSVVKFTIGDDQTITLDRLGTLQILRANFESGKLFTDLGMKYGRTRFDIEAADREHEAKVRSPNSVLAIRGTDVVLYDQAPFAPTAISLTGRAMFRDAKKQTSVGSKGGRKAKVTESDDSPAGYARSGSVVDPRGGFAGRSGNDLLIQQSLGATGRSDFRGLGVLELLDQSGAGQFKGTVIGVLPVDQQLQFDFGITTATAGTVFKVTIETPKGETLSFGNRNVLSGGSLIGDGVIAEGGTANIQAQWPITFPPGNYKITGSYDPQGNFAAVNLNVLTINPNNPIESRTLEPAPFKTFTGGETDSITINVPKTGTITQVSGFKPGGGVVPARGKKK